MSSNLVLLCSWNKHSSLYCSQVWDVLGRGVAIVFIKAHYVSMSLNFTWRLPPMLGSQHASQSIKNN